jgi:hypothetical protein
MLFGQNINFFSMKLYNILTHYTIFIYLFLKVINFDIKKYVINFVTLNSFSRQKNKNEFIIV